MHMDGAPVVPSIALPCQGLQYSSAVLLTSWHPLHLGVATSLSLPFYPLIQLYYLESGSVTTRVFQQGTVRIIFLKSSRV